MSVSTLSPYTRGEVGYGPTATKTAQKRFEQALRGVLGRLNQKIREAIIEDNILGLRAETLIDDPDQEAFQFTTDSQLVDRFVQWVREQLNQEFLTVVQPRDNQYIRQAFGTGLRFATKQLQAQDVDIDTLDITELLENNTQFSDSLETIFTRTYSNLQDVTRDIAESIRQELAQGFAEGKNPTDIARSLTDRVNKIGKHRATLIARTEVINAHTDGTLRRYERVENEADVSISVRHAGRLTAKDTDVCPFCRRTGDEVYTIDEFENTAVLFRGTVYRLAPPSHPNGRCAVTPEVNVGDLAPLEDRTPGRIVTS